MTHIYYCILWGICLILAGCIRDDAAYGEAGIVAGDTLPEFQVELDNGSMLATSDLQGKVSVLVFSIPDALIANRSFRSSSNCTTCTGPTIQSPFIASAVKRRRRKSKLIGKPMA